MARTMKYSALISLIIFGLSFGRNLSLCITFGTISYHLVMRLVVGTVFDRLMGNRADTSRPWYRIRPWEEKIYKKLRVKSWKGRMPSYAPELFSPEKHSWGEIAQAMCQAELVHETIIVFSFLPLLAAIPFGSFPVFFITSLASAAFDLLFVIMQRYNRPRILRLAAKEKNKKL